MGGERPSGGEERPGRGDDGGVRDGEVCVKAGMANAMDISVSSIVALFGVAGREEGVNEKAGSR